MDYSKLLLCVFGFLSFICAAFSIFRYFRLWKQSNDPSFFQIQYSKKSNSFVFVIFERDSKQILEIFLNENICIDTFNRSYSSLYHSWIAINLSCLFEEDLMSIMEVPYVR